MDSSLGWTLLSRDALKRAEAELNSEQGVRDEIGFLLLHQGYSNRFFPGTSVLHTRIRYTIFIPLIYKNICSSRALGDVTAAIEDGEKKLTKRLIDANMAPGAGIIGKEKWPDPTAQSPSSIYWTALSTWGLLYRRLDGSVPTRSAVSGMIRSQAIGSRLADDDESPLSEVDPIFVDVPMPPDWKNVREPLNFTLTLDERVFLRKRLKCVTRSDGADSFLSRLVHQGIFWDEGKMSPWSGDLINYADKNDKMALRRAGQASAMSAIGRAVYDALVELRRQEDGFTKSNSCVEHLEAVRRVHAAKALDLDIDGIHEDIGVLADYFVNVLRETQNWIRKPFPLRDLLPLYEYAERSRKTISRSRLSDSFSGKEKRREWQVPMAVEKGDPTGEPLHYRWSVVTRMLRDLHE
ncbi:DUF6361 family protein [Geomonas oryzae]|uniref:DUF6361 family protein n=1 Tax=Geomonas oryzae TaxID=2364273 RepID=UPI00100B63EC|nr:DUF6361 family protein [Geomonas oryzae]